jgi:aminoglycoside phosphotransferase (APT) family kinase protein
VRATETDDVILRIACDLAGLGHTTATPLHRHATSIWLLPDDGLVARISRSPDDRDRVGTAVAITRWLAAQGFPATEPADVDQPVEAAAASVTFWRYYPQNNRPAPGAAPLGGLLRRLHQLPEPPVQLADYVPLARLGTALESDTPLAADDRAWLAEHRRQLLDGYRELDSELGVGWIHGDAYPGNTLWDGDRVLLGDWDEVARGPRELDLVNTHQGVRLGRTAAERQAFTDAYSWDVTAWPGFAVLREMRDIHTLGAYIDRAAGGDEAAAAEVRYRVQTLRAGDTAARWHSC